jgi:hypothetical protein
METENLINLGGIVFMLLIALITAWQNHQYRKEDKHHESDAEHERKLADQIQLQETVKGLREDITNGLKEIKGYIHSEVSRLDERIDGCHHRTEILEGRFNKHANGTHKQ